MKNDQINVRTSPEDKETLKKASQKLEQETGEKHDTSKTIRESVRRVAEETPDLFFVNRPALRDLSINLESGRVMLQKIVDYCNEIGISVSIDKIESWFGTGGKSLMVANREAITETVISGLLIIQTEKYPGLKFNRSQIVLPDLTPLYETAEQLIFIPDVNYREVGLLWNCYNLDREGKVCIDITKVELVQNQYRAYAVTAEHKSRLARVRTLCRALNAFIADKDVPVENVVLKAITYFDQEAGRFEPSEQFVLYGLTPRLISEQ